MRDRERVGAALRGGLHDRRARRIGRADVIAPSQIIRRLLACASLLALWLVNEAFACAISWLLARPGEEGSRLNPATVTPKPGRDTSVVVGVQLAAAQSDVTDMWPKPRIACVPLAALWEMMAMPPRKPIAATGVRIVAPSEWVATPPTTRNTPLPNERASSPFVVAGL